jgi:hypothetical protein
VRLARGNQWDIDCIKTLARVARNLAAVEETPRAIEVAQMINDLEIRDRTLWYITVLTRGGAPPDRIWSD